MASDLLRRAGLAALTLAAFASAQRLVKDIDPGFATRDSSPAFGVDHVLPTVGWAHLFAATRDDRGTELWKTNGTAAGTAFVKDIRPGSASSSPSGLIDFAGRVFFAADDGVHGVELWSSDGTPANTVLVKDIEPGAASGLPASFEQIEIAGVGARLLFAAQDMRANVGSGRELWISDGTTAGTVLLADLYPGYGLGGTPNSSSPTELTMLIDANSRQRVVFAATAAGFGVEVGVTDGSAAGTRMIYDIRTGSGSSRPTGFRRVRLYDVGVGGVDRAFFSADDGVYGRELWSTNGLFSTRIEADINPGAPSSTPVFADRDYSDLSNSAQVLCFSAESPTVGREFNTLDRLRGRRVWDLRPGAASSMTTTTELRAYRYGCYFSADDGLHGNELWASTDGVVRLIHEFVPGAAGAAISGLLDVGPREVFAIVDAGGAGARIWYYNGYTVSAFCSAVGEQPEGLHFLYEQGSSLFHVAYSGLGGGAVGRELFACSSLDNSSRLMVDINPAAPRHGLPRDFCVVGGRVFFQARTSSTGDELWVTDGTDPGTRMVGEIVAGPTSSGPGLLTAFGGRVYFVAYETTTGTELWTSDGNTVWQIVDLAPGTASSQPRDLLVWSGALYFRAWTPAHGESLWRTDGTAGGTQLVRDPASGGPIDPRALTIYEDTSIFGRPSRLLFTARSPALGRELWTSDGTAVGTSAVLDLNPGTGDGALDAARSIAVRGGVVLFAGNTAATGVELYGFTPGVGAALIRDIWPGTASSNPYPMTFAHGYGYGYVLFEADDGVHGREPWVTFGTDPLTVLAQDIRPGSAGSLSQSVTAASRLGPVFLYANDGTHGSEPWVVAADARTPPPFPIASAALVHDVMNGATGSYYDGRTAKLLMPGSDSILLFAADDGLHGIEPFAASSAGGSRLVVDVNPGSASSGPTGFVRIRDQVLFGADDGAHGTELFAIALGDVGSALAETYGVGCAGTHGVPGIHSGVSLDTTLRSNLPYVGNASWAVRLTGAPAGAACGLFVNFFASPATFGPCTLFTGAAPVVIGAVATAGQATVPIAVPVNPGLIGGDLLFQWIVRDPNGAFIGYASFSDALYVVIGA